MASLSQRFGDVVWKLLFEEIQKFTCSARPEEAESGQNPVASASNEDKENEDDPWEEERSWRDPSAHSLRSVVIDWDNIQSTRKMQVGFVFFLRLFNVELTSLTTLLTRISQVKSILTPNHTSTNFLSPLANVLYWRKNTTENWYLIFWP